MYTENYTVWKIISKQPKSCTNCNGILFVSLSKDRTPLKNISS